MKKHLTTAMVMSLFLILLMCLPVMAESLPSYSGDKTVTWAKNNLERDGVNWTHDCTEFARLCLEAGGVPRDSLKKGGYTPGEYADFLENNGYADKITNLKTSTYVNLNGQTVITLPVAGNEGKVSPGDLIISVCQNPNCPSPRCHASIVAPPEAGSSCWYRYQHANNQTSSFQGYGELRSARCFNCSINDPSKIKFVCYHMKSNENGYTAYTDKVTGVKVTSAAYNKLSVSWTAKASATAGYNIFYMDKSKPHYRLAAHVNAGVTKYVYTIKDSARYGQDISFYVMPCRKGTGAGVSADVGVKSSIAKGHSLPAMPKNVKGKRVSKTKIKVTWKKGAGMTGARVEWRYKGSTKWRYGGRLTKNTFTKSGLKKGKSVQVRIKPYLKSTKGGLVYRNKYKVITIK